MNKPYSQEQTNNEETLITNTYLFFFSNLARVDKKINMPQINKHKKTKFYPRKTPNSGKN
jgi:hypothetical protein